MASFKGTAALRLLRSAQRRSLHRACHRGYDVARNTRTQHGTVLLLLLQQYAPASLATTANRRPISSPNGSVRSLSLSSVFPWNHAEGVSRTVREMPLPEKEEWLERALDDHPMQNVTPADLQHILEALRDETRYNVAAVRRAERWLLRAGEAGVRPTSACYQAVIEAWTLADHEPAAVVVNRAERWLNECIHQAAVSSEFHPDQNDPNIHPTIELYNAFLDACTKGRGGGRNKQNQELVLKNAKKAHAVLQHIHKQYIAQGSNARIVPNTDTFNFVIRGWTRCKREPTIATRTLELLRMMNQYESDNDPHQHEKRSTPKPNTKSYAMVMDALVNVAKQKAQLSARSSRRFNTDSSVNGIDELCEARRILDHLHKLENSGAVDVAPNTVTYNIILSGYAALAEFRHNKAPFEAERILRAMIAKKDAGNPNVKPDATSYEKVMMAWVHANTETSGQRAQWWLKRLWIAAETEADKSLLPSNRTYNIIMNAVLQSDGPATAEKLLKELDEKYQREKDSSLRPNSESFSIVIRGWTQLAKNCQDAEQRYQALQRAHQWLSSVQAAEQGYSISTSPELFVGIITAARRLPEFGADAFYLALQTFRQLQQTRYNVDAKVYAALLDTAINTLSGPEYDDTRMNTLLDIIEECCEEGMMDGAIIRVLVQSPVHRQGWTLDEKKKILSSLFANWPLPASWMRNLKSRRYHPRPEDMGSFWQHLQEESIDADVPGDGGDGTVESDCE